MAKNDALRFLVVKEKDESIKSAFNSIMGKYEEENLSKDEWDEVIQNEVIPFAKKYGYDFTPEDMVEIQKTAGKKMPDEELVQVVGGRGQFSQSRTWYSMSGPIIFTYTNACDLAPDDQTFIARFKQGYTDCPDWVWLGRGSTYRTCACCAHCQYILSTSR